MINVLTILQEAVDKQHLVDTVVTAQQVEAIDQLCKQTLQDMAVIYRHCSSIEVASEHVNQCYNFLKNLLDDLWLAPSMLVLFNSLSAFQQRFEQRYGQYIQPSNLLPLHRQQQLQDEVNDRLPLIIKKLSKKAITACYLEEVSFGMISLFQSSKLPELCYAHQSYIPKLLDSLENMADDKRDKKWCERFVTLLVNLNFNYSGFCNRLVEQIDQHILPMSSKEAKEYLIERIAKVENEAQHPLFAFSLHRPHLLDYLHKHYSHRLKCLEEHEYDINSEDPEQDKTSFITLELNSYQINLFFHASHAVKILPKGSKEESAKIVAAALRTANGVKLSAANLSKYDKEKLLPHAPYMIRKFKDMAKFLEQHFK